MSVYQESGIEGAKLYAKEKNKFLLEIVERLEVLYKYGLRDEILLILNSLPIIVVFNGV